MNDTMVPLSEVAELIVHMVRGQTKQAKPLDADTPASITVKDEKNEDQDVKVKDKVLNPTKSDAAAKEMSDGVAAIVDPYTTEGSDTKAVDESSAVMTSRGSQHGEPIEDKLAMFICTRLDKQWGIRG